MSDHPDDVRTPLLPSHAELAYLRVVVSRDALLGLGTAARLIGGREARAWIEAHVPIRWVAGQRRILWGDVIDASSRASGLQESRPKTPGVRVRLADV